MLSAAATGAITIKYSLKNAGGTPIALLTSDSF